MYRIRKAEYEDIDRLISMRAALQEHMQARNEDLWRLSDEKISGLKDKYKRHIETDRSIVLVACMLNEPKVVGMGIGEVKDHLEYIPSRSGKIGDIWVEKKHRRKGLCKRLIARIMEFFQTQEVKHLSLVYCYGNIEGEKTWKSLGFRPSLTIATADMEDVLSELEGSK